MRLGVEGRGMRSGWRFVPELSIGYRSVRRHILWEHVPTFCARRTLGCYALP